MSKVRVAIIGQGRSGRDIHGKYFLSEANEHYEVVAVVDRDESRRARALEEYPGCRVYADYTELFGQKDIDLVVNSTYSQDHYPVSKDLMEHGFNVLCEKPLCKTPEMVQDLIDTAKANNVQFTIFHQYKFNDYFIQMKRLLKEGVIGDVKLVRACQNSFARRYDWQTLLYRDAGTMRNNAAHSIEQIMDLAESDELPRITSHMDIWNSVGDAEDYMFCRMHYSNGTIYEMEVNPSDAFAGEQPLFKIFGTKGTMKVYNAKIVYKYYKDEEVPTPVLDHKSIHNENGTPAYCNNKLVWHEEEVALKADVWNAFGKCTNRFYHAWYETLVNGAELFMKPEHIKAQIAIFNEIEKQNPLIYKYEKPADLI